MNTKFYGEIFMEEESLRGSGIYYPIKIDYYKTEETDEKLDGKTKYGIKVTKTEYKDEFQSVETDVINGLSEEEIVVDKLLEIFKQNEVTPVVARDIIEDYFYKN